MNSIIRLLLLQIMLFVIIVSAKTSFISDQHRSIFSDSNFKIKNNRKVMINNVRSEDNDIPERIKMAKGLDTSVQEWTRLRIQSDKMLKRSIRKEQTTFKSKIHHQIKHRVTRSISNNDNRCQLKDITDQSYRWINASHVYLYNNTNIVFKVVYSDMTRTAASNQTIIQIRICTEVVHDNWNESVRILNYITPTFELFCYTPLVVMHVMTSRLHERFDYCFLSVLVGTVSYKLLRLVGSFLQHSDFHSISSCYILAVFRHYFLTVTYASIIIVAFDIYFYFSRHTPPDSEGLLKIYYICFTWLIPAMLSVTLFSVDYIDVSYHIKDGTPRCAVIELWARISFILIPCLITFVVSIAFSCVVNGVLKSRKLKHRRVSSNKKLMARKYHRIIQYTTAILIILATDMLSNSVEVTVAIQQRIVQLHVATRIIDISSAIMSMTIFITILIRWLKKLSQLNSCKFDPNQAINHRVLSYDNRNVDIIDVAQ